MIFTDDRPIALRSSLRRALGLASAEDRPWIYLGRVVSPSLPVFIQRMLRVDLSPVGAMDVTKPLRSERIVLHLRQIVVRGRNGPTRRTLSLVVGQSAATGTVYWGMAEVPTLGIRAVGAV